jgi:hypothetical protein
MLWEPAVGATTSQTPQEPQVPQQSRVVTKANIQGKWLLFPFVCCAGTNNFAVSTASSYDADEQELVLPSIEDVFPGLYIKSEPDGGIDVVESSSTIDNSASCSSKQRSPSYDSESTLPQSSPCPPNLDRSFSFVALDSGITGEHLEVGNTAPTPPIRRTLDFGGMVTQRKTVKIVPHVLAHGDFPSLKALRKIERDPPHQWHEDERELLTILYRWYEDADVTTIPKVFNAVTGLDLRLHVVRYQFESHLILYGGCAYPEFDRVMKVPFHDPKHKYDEIHAIIEETASEFGIDISRRTHEVKFTSGLAKTAKSPKTRKHYKSLVRRAIERQRERKRAPVISMPAPENLPLQDLPLGGLALAEQEGEESWSDIDDDGHVSPVTPTQSTPRAPPGTNCIAFRVWDANSRTTFDDERGFVSQAFTIWRGDFPPPFSPDGQGQQALMLLTNLHLSMSGGASAFVSVSTSLLQALVKSSTMEDPRIAVSKSKFCTTSRNI